MPTTTNVKQIGFKQAAQIANMTGAARLAFIAEGLPIIFESAKSLMAASRALETFPRERSILEGHAAEECAKILILVDLVRCPPKRSAALTGTMMRWFYSHLARIIYGRDEASLVAASGRKLEADGMVTRDPETGRMYATRS